MYWTDAWQATRIQRANLDGSGVETIVEEQGARWLGGIALNTRDGKVCWTIYGEEGSAIRCANLDGSGVESMVITEDYPDALALDVAAERFYWTEPKDRYRPEVATGRIRSARFDGSDVKDLVTGLNTPRAIALDTTAGKMYWSDAWARKIQRANLDGSVVEDLVTFAGLLEEPHGMALDLSAGKMYWGIWRDIQRANLDGSSIENTPTFAWDPVDIALDTKAGTIYWTSARGARDDSNTIFRSDIDQRGDSDLLASWPESPSSLALDLPEGKIYWTDEGDWANTGVDGSPTGRIRRANIDGSEPETLVDAEGTTEPHGIDLDLHNRKIYWADTGSYHWPGGGQIRRADIDGSRLETLITDISPWDLALDVQAGKIYWTDTGEIETYNQHQTESWHSSDFPPNGKISRSDMDGSNIETVVSGLNKPAGIALDLANGRVYWTDEGAHHEYGFDNGAIRRANLDGSGMETLVQGLGDPNSIALDLTAGRVYWADFAAGRIQSANLDGSDVRAIVLESARGIAVVAPHALSR